MARLKNRDIQEIVKLFDIEFMLLNRMGKIEKMKLRRKVVNVIQPALSNPVTTTELFMGTVNEKLYDVLAHFIDAQGFRNKLVAKLTKLLQKETPSQISAGDSDSP